MNKKSITAIIAPPPPHMVGDGFRVHNFFPHWQYGNRRMSPFYMMDYNSKIYLPPSNTPRGVDTHPHRGFETVTIVYKGAIEHKDSAGNAGVIYAGGVQWMTAGSGVLHQEYHEKGYTNSGGDFHLVQLWVNLPKSQKMTSPKYQDLQKDDIPIKILDDKGSYVQVIAGNFIDTAGKANTFTPIQLYNMYLKKDTRHSIQLPMHFNTSILCVEGEALVNEELLTTDYLCLLENDGTKIDLHCIEDVTLLILSGEPIDEPIASYGPFLMNTVQEVQQAIADYNDGLFGKL